VSKLACVVAGVELLLAVSAEPALAQRYDCVIQPKSVVELGSPDQGILTKVSVERGQLVEAGQPVAELDSELQRLDVALMRLRVSGNAELESNRAKLAFRKTESGRMDKLYSRKIVSAKQRDEAEIERELAAYNVKTAEMNLDIYRTQLKQAEEKLHRRTVRSPVKGIVTEVMMSAGEYVHEQVSIMKIAELNPLHIEVFLPVALYRDVLNSRAATVDPEAPVGGRYRAEIKVVDQVFDAASETFGVRLLLDNKDYRLPAGLRCQVAFDVSG
jgi:RND family efflux transporter MFP subunit